MLSQSNWEERVMAHNILVLDDTQEQLEWLTAVFQRLGFLVSGYSDGDKLISAISDDIENKYSLALLDLILLKSKSTDKESLQGRDYCLKIKEIKPYFPVFAITGNTNPQNIANTMLHFGFDGFVSKADLRNNPYQYIDHIRSVINGVERYPNILSSWKDIQRIANFAGVVRSSLFHAIQEQLKTAYFFLVFEDSHPLLSLLVPSNSYSYNESILKCAISLEFVLDYEFGDKKTKLSLKRVPKSQSLTISRQIAQISKQQIFNRKEKEEIAAIFEKRNHCAHAGTKRFDKEAALEVIGQTARLLNTYLRWKKEKVFPSSIQ